MHRYRTWILHLVALGLAVPIALALTTPAYGASAPPTLVLSGAVQDASGRSLSAAFVAALGSVTRTGAEGRYTLSGPATAAAVITVWAPGYQLRRVTLHSTTGSPMSGAVTVDFAGAMSLQSMFVNAAARARLSGLPVWTGPGVRRIAIRGIAGEPVEPEGYVTLPSGQVTTFSLRLSAQHFSGELRLWARGAYQVEINATSGLPVFNVTVFHGVKPFLSMAATDAPDPTGVSVAMLARTAVALINRARAGAHLPALVERPVLDRVARAHDADLLTDNSLLSHPHIGSDGSTPLQRAQRVGLGVHTVGEVVGLAPSAATVIDDLLNSPSHRAILLGHYRWIGLAVSRTTAGDLLTADLAR